MTDAISRLNAALDGRYAIDREIGEGGMATVYLARDLRHNRAVALKVLKPELAAVVGAERFLTEIQTTANLQHPNILPLYDSGEADSFLFYVMPHVDGETLRDRLDREGQLPVDEAVRIATGVANALAFAHERGVIHRDIKPGNILFQGGQPVVGDFGIALAVGAGGGGRLTETGLSLGTPFYMSPEQATGDHQVGARSDIYSLGCVLFEMLTGDPPFMGSSAQAVLGQIISGKPVNTTEKRAATPAHVDAAVRCALEKVAADRFSSAEAFAAALRNPAFRHGEDPAGAAVGARGPRWFPWAHAAVTVGLGVALVLGLQRGDTIPDAATVRFEIPLAELADSAIREDGRVFVGRVSYRLFDVSPDGDQLVYMAADGAVRHLYHRPLDRLQTERLPGTEGARGPFFSPNGAWVGFFADGALKRIQLATRQVETLATGLQDGFWPGGGDWGDDGHIVYAQFGVLWRIPEGGGTPERILDTGGSEWVASPEVLPGSRAVLFRSGESIDPADSKVEVLDLGTGERRVLADSAAAPRYSTTGHLLFLREGDLYGVPFDAERLETRGTPVLLDANVLQAWYLDNSNLESGEGQYALSAHGDLVMLRGGPGPETPNELVLVDPEGELRTLDVPAREFAFVRYSPDGAKVAFHAGPGNRNQVGVHTLATGVTQSFPAGGFSSRQPLWSADGQWLVYEGEEAGVEGAFRRRADGSGVPELLLGGDTMSSNFDVTDAGDLVYGRDGDLWVLSADGRNWSFTTSESRETDASVSPDGHWIAHVAQATPESPREVWVRRFPEGEPAIQISSGLGVNPGWSKDGGTLYFRGIDPRDDSGVLYAVDIDFSDGIRPGRPRVHLADFPFLRTPLRGYDVAPDGTILLWRRSPDWTLETWEAFEVVLGFGAELKRRVPN